jgi:hypothetical protein
MELGNDLFREEGVSTPVTVAIAMTMSMTMSMVVGMTLMALIILTSPMVKCGMGPVLISTTVVKMLIEPSTGFKLQMILT